ncbi:DNA ligase D [Amycolatopsis sp. lyj-112]|uniref:DNA ligase D n=1 Tax=Amycolatopsis sp. lyj-112 TaxID=2789288 RepID=UPI00397A6A51
MLAKPDGGRLRSAAGWAYEYKLDGYRCCMAVAPDGTTVLTSRNGIDFTAEFAELAGVLGPALDGTAAVLDGEIVVYNGRGQVEFGALQERRGRYQSHRKLAGHTEPFIDIPVRFLAFDLLQLGDRSLLTASYAERRTALEQIPMPDPYRVAVVPSVTFEQLAADRLTPQNLLDRAAADGAEGLVAKLRTSTYIPGKRPDAWLKHPLIQTQEVILCGWRKGQRGLEGTLGSLILGAHDPATGDLVYVGDVGTGFKAPERARLKSLLAERARRTHPFAAQPPREDTRTALWAEPDLVGEVVFRQFTRSAGRLRHTAWRGLRDDREPADVLAPASPDPGPASPRPPAGKVARPEPKPTSAGSKVTVQAGKRQLTLSNLDKVLYPGPEFTKGEVIRYYSLIAPVLLPHIAGRPVTTIRFPDGVDGQQFFEKNAPRGAPSWLRTVQLPRSSVTGESITYPLLHELASLVWTANLAALELHVPQWTVGPGPSRRMPDRLVFDLDPGPRATIVDCARVAERLHDLLTADGLTPVATTSGSKGMQVYTGVRVRQADRTSAYAKAVADRFAAETPDLVTAKMTKAARDGRVFIDWSQNNPAKTTIAPYSLRGREQPTVATPITWNEVRSCRKPPDLTFTADDVLERVETLGDLFAVVAGSRTALPAPGRTP